MGFLQKDCSHKFKYIYFECYQCEFCGKYSVNGWNQTNEFTSIRIKHC